MAAIGYSMKQENDLVRKLLELIGEDPKEVVDFSIRCELGQPVVVMVQRRIRHDAPEVELPKTNE